MLYRIFAAALLTYLSLGNSQAKEPLAIQELGSLEFLCDGTQELCQIAMAAFLRTGIETDNWRYDNSGPRGVATMTITKTHVMLTIFEEKKPADKFVSHFNIKMGPLSKDIYVRAVVLRLAQEWFKDRAIPKA